MEIKTTMSYHFTPVRMAIIKKQKKSVVKNVEKLKPMYSILLVWKQICAFTMEKSVEVPQKKKKELPYDQQSHFWVFILKNWNQDLKETLPLP